MGDEVGSTRYPPEKCQSKKGKTDRLLPWTYSEEVGWESFTFYFMLCHSKRIFLGSISYVYLINLFLTFTWNSSILGNITEPPVEEYQLMTSQRRDPQVFFFHFSSLPGKTDQSLVIMSSPEYQENTSIPDADFSATVVLCLLEPCSKTEPKAGSSEDGSL